MRVKFVINRLSVRCYRNVFWREFKHGEPVVFEHCDKLVKISIYGFGVVDVSQLGPTPELKLFLVFDNVWIKVKGFENVLEQSPNLRPVNIRLHDGWFVYPDLAAIFGDTLKCELFSYGEVTCTLYETRQKDKFTLGAGHYDMCNCPGRSINQMHAKAPKYLRAKLICETPGNGLYEFLNAGIIVNDRMYCDRDDFAEKRGQTIWEYLGTTHPHELAPHAKRPTQINQD